MTYAIVHKDRRDRVILDIDDYPHIYNSRAFAEDVCLYMGTDYMVVPW